MSYYLYRWRAGTVKTVPGYKVHSEYLADIAAAHHIDAKRAIKKLADHGALAAQARMSAHVSTRAARKGDFKFSIRRETGFLDEYVWLETAPKMVAGGKGRGERAKNMQKRARQAVGQYEYKIAHPLQAAWDAMQSAG